MITVNGREYDISSGLTVGTLLDRENYRRHHVAVELNGRIVPRAEFDSTAISDGDRIEIVHFVGGG